MFFVQWLKMRCRLRSRSIRPSRERMPRHHQPPHRSHGDVVTAAEGDCLDDVTVIDDGWHGDTSRMYLVGKVPAHAKRLVDVTKDCLFAGINEVKPGATLGDVGFAIQALAEKNHYSVVRDYCGHGIGQTYHEEPQVMHYGQKGEGLKLEEGMCFTIEPMINLGTHHSKVLNDGWTVVTKDGKLSAQWEHTVAVTKDGHEILTLGD